MCCSLIQRFTVEDHLASSATGWHFISLKNADRAILRISPGVAMCTMNNKLITDILVELPI